MLSGIRASRDHDSSYPSTRAYNSYPKYKYELYLQILPKKYESFANNDLEGWHRRLNNHARRGQIQFYLLVELLHKEAKFVSIQTKLVSDGKLKRQQRRKHRDLQKELKKMWKRFNNRKITISQILSGCSQLTNKL